MTDSNTKGRSRYLKKQSAARAAAHLRFYVNPFLKKIWLDPLLMESNHTNIAINLMTLQAEMLRNESEKNCPWNKKSIFQYLPFLYRQFQNDAECHTASANKNLSSDLSCHRQCSTVSGPDRKLLPTYPSTLCFP